MGTVDWAQVGAVAAAATALALVLFLAVAVLTARAARIVARRSEEVVGQGRQLVAIAARRADLAGAGWQHAGELAAELAAELRRQATATSQALAAAHTPLLVPAPLAPPGRASADQLLHVQLPDGPYYPPGEQSVGAWTVEVGSRTLVVCGAFCNVGIGPAVLSRAHRIDLVRRGGEEPLYSFRGYGQGVVPVGGRALVAFPMSATDPAHGHTLLLLDRPDDEVHLLVTVYYRSAASSRMLWSRVRYRRHLRISPAGLLSELSLDLPMPDDDAALGAIAPTTAGGAEQGRAAPPR
ncbi:MAG TPA: hypothetical protein VKV36_09755 [Acidimicrobiales bacterium]|nr:hypothetical protein [Acidimicrobiales bacterium]